MVTLTGGQHWHSHNGEISAENAGESAKCSNIAYTAPIRRSRPLYDKLHGRDRENA